MNDQVMAAFPSLPSPAAPLPFGPLFSLDLNKDKPGFLLPYPALLSC